MIIIIIISSLYGGCGLIPIVESQYYGWSARLVVCALPGAIVVEHTLC